MSEQKTYRIPAINLARLQHEIEALNKKAKKLSKPPVNFVIHDKEIVVRKDDMFGTEYDDVTYIVSVEGETPKLHGWKLIAVIEPQKNAENLVREVPGQICPKQFRKAKTTCDHCKVARRRNEIFVLQNENGEYNQVGRTCLQDFLGGIDPKDLLANAEYIFNFCGLCLDAEHQEWGTRVEQMVPITRFVAAVSVIIRRLGWVSRSDAGHERSTADCAWDVCVRSNDRSVRNWIKENDLKADDSDVAKAKAAIEWAGKISSEDASNNYMHSLGVCCRQDAVTFKNAGYVGSVIGAHNRYLTERLESELDLESKHVGEIKEKIVLENLLIIQMKENPSQYGLGTFVKFRDPSGNVFIWWASGCPEWLEIGKTVSITGTVSKHSDYKGKKQTELKRCRQND